MSISTSLRSLLLAGAVALGAGCYNPDLPDVGLYCHATDDPACPSGSTCKPYQGSFRCLADTPTGALSIPKSGTYTGTRKDPALNSDADCPDITLEPNDTLQTATNAPTVALDQATPKIIKLAICPLNKKPADIDVYKVDLTNVTGSSAYLFAEIFYDVSYGDLDVGIFDSAGTLVAGDGTAVSNGCVAASVGAGIYYVAVKGATSADVNRYEAHIRGFSTPKSCTAGPTDL